MRKRQKQLSVQPPQVSYRPFGRGERCWTPACSEGRDALFLKHDTSWFQRLVALSSPKARLSRRESEMRSCSKSMIVGFGLFLLASIIALTGMQVPCVAQELTASATKTLSETRADGLLRSRYLKSIPQRQINVQPRANLKAFREEIKPRLKEACFDCHGRGSAEGDLRIDELDPNLLQGDDVEKWLEIATALSNREMPPEDGAFLPDADREKIVDWLSSELQIASRERRPEQEYSSFRRLTRYEYNYALQDLLGLELDFATDLPRESALDNGFKNSSEVLQMTGSQYETYLDLNRKALNRATVRGERPEVLCWSVSAEQAAVRQEKTLVEAKGQATNTSKRNRARGSKGAQYKNTKTGKTVAATWSWQRAEYALVPATSRQTVPEPSEYIAVLPGGQRFVIELGNRLPDEGTLRVRVRASQLSSEPSVAPTLALEFGWQGDKDWKASARISSGDLVVDAAAEQPGFYQWDIPLEDIHTRNPVRKTKELGAERTTNPSEYIRLYNTSSSRSAAIQFDYVEVFAPAYDQWPPASHKRIFIDSDQANNETAYAREIVSQFMKRCWRRSVTETEVDLKMKHFASVLSACDDFEQAVIETLATVLSSPRFLYLIQSDQAQASANRQVDEFELATRLSMFLWCSVPDDELIELAATGQLSERGELTRQAKRMLADSRHERFSKHFVRQWLDMELLDYLKVDESTFPQFDRVLLEAMKQEPIAFFEEVLQNDRSVLEFIHSDYAMVNGRLAEHYGIEGVSGDHFQKVSLKPEDNRGGLLTQAGLLAMNSDGADSNPLKRGIWLLESILNDPPPPPPAAVPEIDLANPEILKMTLKERIEDHRNNAACLSCHARIDPWGIAFENFDAVGSYRSQIQGKDVDASSLLFNQQPLDGVEGLKRHLLASRQDQFVRALVHKMASFALGRPLSFADHAEVDSVTSEVRKNGDGLQALILKLVDGELFRGS